MIKSMASESVICRNCKDYKRHGFVRYCTDPDISTSGFGVLWELSIIEEIHARIRRY